MDLQAINNQVPVTALKFVDNELLLAGAGSFLKLYDWRRSQLLRSVRLFPLDDVHGIHLFTTTANSNVNCAVVWGGRTLSVISNTKSLTVGEQGLLSCKDRIIDAQVFTPSGADAPVLYILTAHNEVLKVDLQSMKTIEVLKCSERSILYSGKLYLSANTELVGAGTVFGGVVVWDLHSSEITNNFEMHEGSIFDVEWSADGRFLASCSDDRAIYLSDLKLNKPIAEGWGHISRIWKLKFAQNGSSINKLVSVAEDCSARVWDLGKSELHCSRIMTGHQGRSIWSLDIRCSGDMNVAVTGGGDGKIMLWDLDQQRSDDQENVKQWGIETEFGAAVRSCCVTQNGNCAVTTVSGNLFVKLADTKAWQLVGEVGPVPIVKSLDNLLIAVANDGQVLIVDSASGNKCVHRFRCETRVLDFFVLSPTEIVLVPTPPAVCPILVRVSPNSELETNELQITSKMGTPTCAAQCGENKFCLGTRKGDLIMFELGVDEPLHVHSRALGQKSDAVTQLAFVDAPGLPYVLASSRSSEYGYFAVPDLTRMSKTRSRKRGSIEGFSLSSQGLLLWGFQKDFFVAWNVTLGCDFISMDCGGSHRSWALQVLDNELVFMYIRASELYIHTIRYPGPWFNTPMVQSGTHGREIRGFEASPNDHRLVATGSEDTVIKIGWINPLSDSPESVSTASAVAIQYPELSSECLIRDGHVSGIQCLHWSPCGKYLLTGAGQGELVLWEVVAPKSFGPVFASEVSRMPSKVGTSLHELRVMDFSICGDLIAVAYSDSSFRIWKLSTWELLLEQKYRECCLLNIDLLLLPQKAEEESVYTLVITSTDGHLVVYYVDHNDEGLLQAHLKLREPIHQSSVRSSCVKLNGSTLEHFSGGDDNAVCGTTIELNDDPEFKLIFKSVNAHSSAVTSVNFLPNSDKFVSTGSDQKVHIWECSNGNVLASAYTSVSDTGAIIVDEKHILTAGIGIEYFALH